MNIAMYRTSGLIGVMLLAGVLSGCASTLNTGASNYGCSGLPEGVSCMSAREVYELTEQPGPVRADPKGSEEEDRAAQTSLLQRRGAGPEAGAEGSALSGPMSRQGNVLADSPITKDPVPIRTRAKIMRVWVAPWESTNGDLNVSGLVFTELESRRWNLGVQETKELRLRPLQSQVIKPLAE